MHELGGSEKATADAFASGQYVTPQDYATAFENKYERAGGSKIDMRQQYALEVFNAMQSPELAAGLPQNARTSYEYFIKQGMSPQQAAGIVGNLMVESFNKVDPQAFNPAGGNMGAYGVAQWRGPRQQGLLDFAKTRPQPLAAPGIRGALNMQPQQNINRKVQPMQQRPQTQQNGLLGFFKNQNPSTGLTKAQQFAAALDPLIMPSMRGGEAIRAQGQQRVKQKTNNATAAYLRANGMGDVADMMEAGNIDGSAVTSALMQARMATPKTPSRIQLIKQLMSEFGMTQEQAIKASGSGGINIGGTEKEYDKKMGGSFADKEIAINKASTNATETLTTVRMMKDIAMQPNFETGSGSDGLLQANKFFSRLFGSSTDVSDNETFKSLSNQLILKNLGGSLGVGVSNADLAFIQTTVPTINNTKEGIKQMLNIQEKLAMRQIQIGQLAMKWRSENSGKMLTSEWDMYLNTWKEANPLFVNAS